MRRNGPKEHSEPTNHTSTQSYQATNTQPTNLTNVQPTDPASALSACLAHAYAGTATFVNTCDAATALSG